MIIAKGNEELARKLARFDDDLRRDFVAYVTDDVYRGARKKAAPHGNLSQSIEQRVRGSEGEVFVNDAGNLVQWRGRNVNKAVFVHFGTRPHPIDPVKKKALRWVSNGNFVFAKHVNHPGYKGDPFLYDAVRETMTRLDQYAQRILDDNDL